MHRQFLLGYHATVTRPEYTFRPNLRPFPTDCIGKGTIPEDRLSWLVALLPYLEKDPLYRKFDLEKGYADNLAGAQSQIPLYLCPEAKQREEAVTNYIAPAGIGTNAASQPVGAVGNVFMSYDRKTSFAIIKDDTSNTIAIMGTRSNVGPWARGGFSTVRGFDPTDVPICGELVHSVGTPEG